MKPVSFYGASDLGRIRNNNEDDFIVQYIWDKNHVLAVVIDGVGGYEGGEVAAALAHETIVAYLEQYPDGERQELLKQAVIAANNKINAERELQPQFSHMSCVLTAALVELEGRRINMAHVGDTRLYEFANGMLSKLSHDHSLVGYREEIGDLTEEQAMKHPQRNIISRDVGSSLLDVGSSGYIETSVFPLLSDSTLMLCSDGLCDMVTSAQMTEILRSHNSAKSKVEALIAAANEAGGKDNVTVVVVDIDIEDAGAEEIRKTVEKAAPDVTQTKKSEKSKAAKRSLASKPKSKAAPLRIKDDGIDFDDVPAPVAEEKKNGRKVILWFFCILLVIIGFVLGCVAWSYFSHRPTSPTPVEQDTFVMPEPVVRELEDPNDPIFKDSSDIMSEQELNNDQDIQSNNIESHNQN